eukprot:gene9541-45436_t
MAYRRTALKAQLVAFREFLGTYVEPNLGTSLVTAPSDQRGVTAWAEAGFFKKASLEWAEGRRAARVDGNRRGPASCV